MFTFRTWHIDSTASLKMSHFQNKHVEVKKILMTSHKETRCRNILRNTQPSEGTGQIDFEIRF